MEEYMSPNAEIWVPNSVSEEDLKRLLSSVGGRVEKFQEPKPIPVKEISPASMAAFLNESSTLRVGPDPTYVQIFNELRKLPLNEQKELLVRFYSQGVKDFPNGEKLGKYLAEINNIRWFQPEKPPDEKSLKELCHQVSSRLNIPDLPLRIIEEDWHAAWYAAQYKDRFAYRDTTLNATEDAIRYATGGAIRGAVWRATLNAPWDATGGAIRYATEDAIRYATLAAEWIVIKDLMPAKGYNKNPFDPLMEIYKLGCWPIGAVLDPTTKKEEFVVFIPPIQKTVYCPA